MLATNTTNNRLNLGYKKTKLGWIPNEWSIEMLEAIAKVVMGQSPKGNSYNENKKGVPLINGPTEFTNRYPVEKQWTTKPTKLSEKGDILICVRGSSTGRINISNGQYCIGRGVAAIRSTIKSDQRFIEYQLYYQLPRLLKLTSGSTFPNINSKNIKRLRIPTPPLPEQKKIAEILSTWDEAIEKLERLIAKKEELKRGLMQQLLTGKKRFRGFEGEWKKKSIKSFSKVITGSTPRTSESKYYNGDYLFVSPSDMDEIKYIHATEKTLTEQGFERGRVVPKGSTLFVAIGSTIGKTAMAGVDLTTNQQIHAIVTNEKVFLNEFFFYQLTRISDRIKLLAGKQAVPILNKSNFESLRISFPSVQEQKKIVDILSNIDNEIEILKKNQDMIEEQKKGLMQQLLTGKRRVIKFELKQ